MSDQDNWTGQFRTPAKRTDDDLDEHARKRITDKLDEIVNDQWREPDDYLEPITGVPHSKLRIGQFRLGADCNYGEKILDVYIIEHRSGRTNPTTIEFVGGCTKPSAETALNASEICCLAVQLSPRGSRTPAEHRSEMRKPTTWMGCSYCKSGVCCPLPQHLSRCGQ